ncbi:YqaA family protein [Coralloluteibacterium stylophorae]|uniref:DedA family protein n=1 Tax=Coralloluteibacterium stylophorae TaxID=1776034 RepID=A0A8J7VX48_9GAMM|nr:YqaA family protein [Coralloluteibacterium stylophorae]MBS7459002.1 DedA family protein [Coralloluteibacterium stylophorae]
MRLFGPLYDRCIQWARHRHAVRYLAALSAAEAIVFPIPPDVMLIPMALAQPRRWVSVATVCTVASVLGGLVGYLLGHFALELVMPLIERAGQAETFAEVQALFARYGFWIVLVAGFTPIPFKVFTVASGAAGMPLLPFVLGSFAGRGGRFYLVAALVALAGPKVEPVVRRYIEIVGWIVGIAVLAVLAWLQFGH